MSEFGRILSPRRCGSEPFRDAKRELGFDLLSFWQWSSSDVVSNATRGILAEYLVARAVGAADGVRDEWAAYDLRCPDGTTIEVKSAAYVQSWYQSRPSAICFSCPRTHGWDAETNQETPEKQRHAQVYVFALLANKDQETLDPLDGSQWEFYVVPTVWLDQRTRSQHSPTLNSLQKLHGRPHVSYSQLAGAVREAAKIQRAKSAGLDKGRPPTE